VIVPGSNTPADSMPPMCRDRPPIGQKAA
jgi:hypothetical protein